MSVGRNGSSHVRMSRRAPQRHHGADVFAEIGQRLGGVCEDARVVASHLQGSPCEIGALQSVRPPVFAPVRQQVADNSNTLPRRVRARNADRARSPAP